MQRLSRLVVPLPGQMMMMKLFKIIYFIYTTLSARTRNLCTTHSRAGREQPTQLLLGRPVRCRELLLGKGTATAAGRAPPPLLRPLTQLRRAGGAELRARALKRLSPCRQPSA